MAHFNKGIVFGKITKVQEDKMGKDIKTTCANIHILVDSDFGPFTVFAKVMREELAAQFIHEELQGKFMRLEGFFAQYKDREGVLKSNYNIFSWTPLSEGDRKDQRAVFILTGDVENIVASEGGAVVEIVLRRDEYKNTFQLWMPDVIGLEPQKTYKFKGELRGKYDRYGENSGTRAEVQECTVPGKHAARDAAPAPLVEEGEIPF